MQIGVFGATGPAGSGLAARLASLGHDVLAGSRDAARAARPSRSSGTQWGERLSTLPRGGNAEAAVAPIWS